MIKLEINGRLTRWFVWCCDNLPLTVTRDYSKDKESGVRRNGAYYLERGTTLCHIFWATLWIPIAIGFFVSFLVFMLGMLHVAAYHDFGDKLGPAALLIPEAFALGIAALMALFILALVGGDKSGFFKLLWQYLSGIKSRVCPLVKFTADQS